MAREFGNRRQSQHQSGVSKSLLLALVFFLFGYLSASVFDFTSLCNWINAQLLLQGTSPPKPAPIQAQLPKPKLEFYTLLASARTEPIEQAPRPNQPAPSLVPVVTAKQVPMPLNKASFLVQVAAFKTRQEAEKMKASLTLKGFMITLTVDNPQKISWYRVCIGPFPTRIQAQQAQMALSKSERIVGMIRKLQA